MGSGILLKDTAALVFRAIVISHMAIVTRPGMPECSNKEGIGEKHPPSALLKVMRKLKHVHNHRILDSEESYTCSTRMCLFALKWLVEFFLI